MRTGMGMARYRLRRLFFPVAKVRLDLSCHPGLEIRLARLGPSTKPTILLLMASQLYICLVNAQLVRSLVKISSAMFHSHLYLFDRYLELVEPDFL